MPRSSMKKIYPIRLNEILLTPNSECTERRIRSVARWNLAIIADMIGTAYSQPTKIDLLENIGRLSASDDREAMRMSFVAPEKLIQCWCLTTM